MRELFLGARLWDTEAPAFCTGRWKEDGVSPGEPSSILPAQEWMQQTLHRRKTGGGRWTPGSPVHAPGSALLPGDGVDRGHLQTQPVSPRKLPTLEFMRQLMVVISHIVNFYLIFLLAKCLYVWI